MKLNRALGVALVSLALALGAMPAQAALYSHNDAVGDVFAETCTGAEFEDCTEAVDPTIKNGDIVNANIRHQWRRVLIRVKQRDIKLNSFRAHFVRIVTNEGQQRYVTLVAAPGQTRPMATIVRAKDETKVPCRGLWTAYDHGTDMVTVIVPRYCLSYPRWVRVGVGSVIGDGTDTSETLGFDELMLNGTLSDELRMSPRIRRS